MSPRRLGISNYFVVLRTDLQALRGDEANRGFLRQFKTDPSAMRDLRTILAASPGIGMRPLLSDEDVLAGVARLMASGQLVMARVRPARGGNATQEVQTSASAEEAASNQLRTRKTWIEIRLVDDSGKPVSAEAYQIELPDGSVVRGRLDSEGSARFNNIDPGTCQVSFPNLDAPEWTVA